MAPTPLLDRSAGDPVALPKRLPTWRPADVEWQKPTLRAGFKALVAYYQPYLIIGGCAFVTGFCLTLLVAVVS